jgi:hypothetical protein
VLIAYFSLTGKTKESRNNLSKSIKDTQTEKNLLTAFAGESQAWNRRATNFWRKIINIDQLIKNMEEKDA